MFLIQLFFFFFFNAFRFLLIVSGFNFLPKKKKKRQISKKKKVVFQFCKQLDISDTDYSTSEYWQNFEDDRLINHCGFQVVLTQ